MKSSSNVVDSEALESWKFMPKVRVRQGGETNFNGLSVHYKIFIEQLLLY